MNYISGSFNLERHEFLRLISFIRKHDSHPQYLKLKENIFGGVIGVEGSFVFRSNNSTKKDFSILHELTGGNLFSSNWECNDDRVCGDKQ